LPSLNADLNDAGETTLKRTQLADYGIVYFATHGLVAGDVKGLAEPSLVRSIPKAPSEFDDSLLTASEVAQLKLNADRVVLSACNTCLLAAHCLSGVLGAVCADRRGRGALNNSDCAPQQFWPNSAADGWSRNHDGKLAKSAAAND
jgi:CHAT domain